MGTKLELTSASAEELRTLARDMYGALEEIGRATEEVYRVYQSVQDDVGPHAEQFQEMLDRVRAAKDKMGEVMIPIRDKMTKTASKIDEFVARKLGQ